MRRTIVACVLALCLDRVPAQGFLEGLAAADARIDAKRWREALEVLLPLQAQTELDEDFEVLAARLHAVGRALVDTDLDAALRAHTAATAMWKRLYGDRDHPDVASSLSNIASCLELLGRAADALP